MIKLEIDNKEYHVPQSFEELTFEQYCKAFYKLPKVDDDMEDYEKFKVVKENESRILSRILGEGDDFCLNLPLNIYSLLSDAIKFIYDSEYFNKNAKAGIVIDGKRYSIPPFGEMSLRQYIDADMVMKGDENDMQYIELLSILLTTKDNEGKWIPYDGKYEELMGKVRSMPCSMTLPLVYHFFKKGEALKKLSQACMKAEELSQQLQHTANS